MTIKVTQLASFGEKFAVSTRSNQLHVFDITVPVPVKSMKLDGTCYGLLLEDGMKITIIDSSNTLKSYGLEKPVKKEVWATESSEKTLFSSYYNNNNSSQADNTIGFDVKSTSTSLFDGFSHQLPRPSLLVEAFLKNLVEVKNKVEETVVETVEVLVDDEEDEMVVERETRAIDLDFLDSYLQQIVI